MMYMSLLKEKLSLKRIAIFGAGGLGRLWYEVLKDKLDIVCFIDNDLNKQNDDYLGLPVYSVEKFNEIKNGMTVIVSVADTALMNMFTKQLEDICGFKLDKDVVIMKPFLDELPDEVYLKGIYRIHFGKELKLDDPKTFNEKIQWLKLYNRKPEYTQMADKYEARKYIAEKVGTEYLVPLLGVWENYDEIDFDKLPEQFVLKCNHDSGSVIICNDKNSFDFNAAKLKLNGALEQNWFYTAREWAYKDIKPRIIAEDFLGDNIFDYKFHCFNGEAKIILVTTNRFTGAYNRATHDYFDMSFNRIGLKVADFPNAKFEISYPYNLNEMKSIAEEISIDIPFLRVDFFVVNKKIYIGELTFYPDGGFGKYYPEKYDEILGSWLEL